MKQILIALLLATATPSIAAEPPTDYCDDQASWQQWQQLLADNPQDNGITSLYAFRIGLCFMVRTGMIDTDRAIRLFEQLRDTVIKGKQKAEDTGRVEM